MHSELIVRAVDVGYGHTKFTSGRDSATNLICTDSIPSLSRIAKENRNSGKGVMSRHDTFIVPVGDRFFEVGRDVANILHGNQVSEVMDDEFALSDAYNARLLGALNYMAPTLPNNIIDILVLGLPLTTFAKHNEALAERFRGVHVINNRGETIEVKSCHVYPQPFGSYTAYTMLKPASSHAPLALVVDPGYNTFDWYVCQGMTAHDNRSDAVQRGVGSVLRAIAEDLKKKYGFDASADEVVRTLDRALSKNLPFQMYGKVYDLAPHMAAGNDIIDEAAQSAKNSVGSGSDIEVIIVTGGGASYYAKAIANKFPLHEVVTLEYPATANVRGFHLIGEMLARSRRRALNVCEEVA